MLDAPDTTRMDRGLHELLYPGVPKPIPPNQPRDARQPAEQKARLKRARQTLPVGYQFPTNRPSHTPHVSYWARRSGKSSLQHIREAETSAKWREFYERDLAGCSQMPALAVAILEG